MNNERDTSGSDQLCLPRPMFSSTCVSKDLIFQYLVSQYLYFSWPSSHREREREREIRRLCGGVGVRVGVVGAEQTGQDRKSKRVEER